VNEPVTVASPPDQIPVAKSTVPEKAHEIGAALTGEKKTKGRTIRDPSKRMFFIASALLKYVICIRFSATLQQKELWAGGGRHAYQLKAASEW